MNELKKPRIGVGVLLLKNGKALLGRRHPDAQKAGSDLHGEGTWTMPGGKLEFGERLDECAYREVFEETGIKIDKKKLELISVSDDIVADAHFVTVGFLSKDFNGKVTAKEPDKIVEWQWFSLDKLPSPLFFPSKRMFDNYLNKKVYSM